MAQFKLKPGHHAVIVSHYRGVEDTNECLASIDRAKAPDVAVYLVVTGDKKGLKLDYPWLTYLRTSRNLGFSGSNNLGIQQALKAGANLITLLNNDTTVRADVFLRIQSLFKSQPKLGASGGKIYFYPGREYHCQQVTPKMQGRVIWYAGGIIDWLNVEASHRGVDQLDTGQFDNACDTEFVTGCLFSTSRYILNQVGLLDQRYFLYLEDVDLSQRIKNAGFRVIYDPSQVIWHKNASSSGGSGSILHDYYLTRNRLIFGFRYARPRTKLALFKHSLHLLATGRPWQRQAVIDFYRHRWGEKQTLHSNLIS